MRRLFWLALGATVGILLVRRLARVAQKFTPQGAQDSLAGALGNVGDALREFTAEVREGMAEREADLRTGLGLDGSHDAVDAHTLRPPPEPR